MPQFVIFLMVGGFAAAVNVVSRYVLNIALSYQVSIVIAYIIAMITAYVLNRLLVFKVDGSVKGQLFRFTIVNIVALFFVWGTSMLFARIIFPGIGMTWYPDDIAHMIGVAVPAVSSYLGHKYFTFRAA